MTATRAPHFFASLLGTDTEWGLRIERNGEWLVRSVELAVDSITRRRGLLGRNGLAPENALVIAPSQGVHTFGMRFPIDIVGVARDGRVVKLRHAVPRGRIVLALNAFAIFELAAGVSSRVGLAVGDRLVATPLTDPRSEQERPPKVTAAANVL